MIDLDLEVYEYNVDYNSGGHDDIVFIVVHEEVGRDVEIEVFRSEYTARQYAWALARESTANRDDISVMPPFVDAVLLLRYNANDYVYVERKCVRDA